MTDLVQGLRAAITAINWLEGQQAMRDDGYLPFKQAAVAALMEAETRSGKEPVSLIPEYVLATLESATVEHRDALRAALAQMDKCEHVCASGPGHQSKRKCEARGRHDEHHVDENYWTDEQEVEVERKPWKRGPDRHFLRDDEGQLIPDEPYTEMVYFAEYWG